MNGAIPCPLDPFEMDPVEQALILILFGRARANRLTFQE